MPEPDSSSQGWVQSLYSSRAWNFWSWAISPRIPSSEQMLTFIMLARLATLCPVPVLQRVDRLIEPLRATCTAKVSPLPSPRHTCQVLCWWFMVTIN